MIIQLAIYISGLGHYSNHQTEAECYFCLTVNKANEKLIDFIFPAFTRKTESHNIEYPWKVK